MLNNLRKLPGKKQKRQWFVTHRKNFFILVLSIVIVILGMSILWLSSFRIPDFRDFEQRKVVNSTKIYDRTGKILLFDLHQDVKRTDISFDEMGSNIKNATVAIEDSEFYNHQGIRPTSIIRAILYNILKIGNNTQGGSTITQQLVKNSLLTQKKTYARKIKEWILAVEVDRTLPKEKILEYYLNENPYGGNVYGIEEAARTYFGKRAQDLTMAEAAYLAAIPQSPTTLSPYGKNRDKLEERKNLVLRRELDLAFITEEEYQKAKMEEVVFIPQAASGIKAPHFVFFIKDYLEEKYGAEALESGLNVISTLDYNLQLKGEEIVREGALLNAKSWDGENSGLVAIDPKTGQILTMVGSRGYFDKDIDGNYNIATAKRQPGSSFKPFIYATAFNKGFTPSTTLFDLPTEFSTTCNAYGIALPGRSQESCYKPSDFDGKYRGPMALKDALAQSINIPAVKLFYLVGTRDAIKVAQDMGISTLTDPSRYGLTLVIGGGEVTLLDMTSSFGVFANDGVRNPYTSILKVETSTGKILEEFIPEANTRQVLPKNTALTISDIMSDNTARIPTFGVNSKLVIPGHQVAAKTGTTNNNKDAWTIGYTPSLSVGVWVGNNNNTPMKKGGVSLAGPIWNKFMVEALKSFPNEQFERPNLEVNPETVKPVLRGSWQGNENFFIDKISGKLATENTPNETREEKIITNVHNILYWIDRSNITGPPPSNPENDSQFSHWEIPVQNWWVNNAYIYPKTTREQIPFLPDDVHTGDTHSNISIIQPNQNTIYLPNQKIQLQISDSGKFPLKKIEIFINDVYLGNSEFPFNFSFIPLELDNLRENNEIKIISYDSVYNRGENTASFKVNMDSVN